jgi:hypothetical protein
MLWKPHGYWLAEPLFFLVLFSSAFYMLFYVLFYSTLIIKTAACYVFKIGD